jgi:hypothetical protein
MKRGNLQPWQCTTLRFQTLWTRTVTKEGAKREQCGTHARRLKVRQMYSLHTALQLGGDCTSDARLVSEQPHATVLREGSRLNAVSNFVNLDVSNFDHSWLPNVTPLFRTFVAGSGESECDRTVGQHSPPTAQITPSSVKLCLSLREAASHASRDGTLQQSQPEHGG